MRKISDLNNYELRKVFENNSKLQTLVFDDMFETANFYCEEYLNCWKRGSIDYCIGWDRGTYFTSTEHGGFIDGLRQAQRSFCFLADDWNAKIDYVDKLIGRLDYLYYNSSAENYDRLEARIDELIEELENACYRRFMLEYDDCFNYENQLDYFISFYSNERMDDNFYINENYELFEHVDYIKSYT